MRSYENSGYNPFNENDRTQSRGSARNYYSGEFDLNSNRMRGAHDSGNRNIQSSGEFGTGRDTYASSGHGIGSTYGRSHMDTSRDNNLNSGSSGWSGSSNYGNSGYGSGSSYGTSGSRLNDYRSSARHDNRDWDRNRHDNSWDRTSNRIENSWDRAGDKIENAWERTKNKASNAWDRMTDDDDNNYSHRSSTPRNYNTYGTSGSSSSFNNPYGSRTGSESHYGSGNRYASDRFNRDRDHDHDRGFFDRAGDEVKSWFGDDEAERRRRMDEMRDRQEDRDFNNSYRRTGSTSYGNTYSGPPYSYGSSSRRDYEW